MEFYGYYRSSAAYRVRIALAWKGVHYHTTEIDLAGAEQGTAPYLALNPQGLVPALDIGDGELLTQSVAILEWLEERHPLPPLLPQNPQHRARVRAMVQAVACDIHPLNNLRVLQYLTGELGVSEDTKLRWYHHWLAPGLAALEQLAQGDRYCWGDEVSMADVLLVPQLYNARRFHFDLGPYPRLVAIDGHLNTLAAFAEAAPERQPTAPPAPP